jgi:hypothetical protein
VIEPDVLQDGFPHSIRSFNEGESTSHKILHTLLEIIHLPADLAFTGVLQKCFLLQLVKLVINCRGQKSPESKTVHVAIINRMIVPNIEIPS